MSKEQKRCPICGKYAAAEAVSKYDALVLENSSLKAEKDALAQHIEKLKEDKAKAVSQYQQEHAKTISLSRDLNELECKYESLLNRGLLARILNRVQ